MNARRLLGIAVVASLGLAPAAYAVGPHDAASKITKNPFLKAGIRLYNDLEFNAALEQLKRAESFPGNTVGDDVLVHIYEGIVQYENNSRDAAETEFTTALALDPNAVLPRNVSPKIVELFESVRSKLQKEKEVVTPTVQPPPPHPADLTAPPAAAEPSTPPAPASTPAGGLTASTASPEPHGPHVAPWILLGTTAVLGGVGTVFAIRAHSQGADAQSAPFQDDANASLSSAKTSAVVAYSALGAAAAAAAACVTLFIIDGSSGSAGSAGDSK